MYISIDTQLSPARGHSIRRHLALQDEEELNCAPEEVLAEEERLRKEREEANKETLQVGI